MGHSQFPLNIESEREALENEAIRLIRATPSDVLVAYLPVFARHSEPPPPPPPRLSVVWLEP